MEFKDMRIVDSETIKGINGRNKAFFSKDADPEVDEDGWYVFGYHGGVDGPFTEKEANEQVKAGKGNRSKFLKAGTHDGGEGSGKKGHTTLQQRAYAMKQRMNSAHKEGAAKPDKEHSRMLKMRGTSC